MNEDMEMENEGGSAAEEQMDVLELVEMLYDMISEAWGVPLGNDRCLIDRNKALDVVEEIKAQLPPEIAAAKRLIAKRDEYIGNAKREGESIRKAAEERSRKLVDEQEVVKMARARAEELIATAETKSRELRRAANEYVSESMKTAEDATAQALEVIRQTRARFQSAAGGYAARKADSEE